MGALTVLNNLTLDGVMQAPGSPDEDLRDGFTRGGWAIPYSDEVMAEYLGAGMASNSGGLLFGRRTYESFAATWPQQVDNPVSRVLDETAKFVASRTLTEPLPWQNSTLLSGDVVEAISALKREQDLTVMGSGDLLRTLVGAGLVDVYTLLVHPLVLGTGRRMFDGVDAGPLRLVDSLTTTTGVIIGTYRPGGTA